MHATPHPIPPARGVRPACVFALLATAVLVYAPGARALTPATMVVERQTVPVEQVLDGVIEPTQESTVAAQTSGRVIALPYDVDDRVPAGAVIVRLTDETQRAALAQAQAGAREAQARLAEAQTAYQRTADLYRRKSVSSQDMDRARADLDAAKARVSQAAAAVDAARQQLDYTVIKAPYGGVVVSRHVELGETVSPGQPLMTGYASGRMRVVVHVPQEVAGALRKPPAGASGPRILLDDGRVIPAAHVLFSPYADPATHTFRVRLDLPENTPGIFPGTFVKVAFTTARAQRLLVPASALAVRGEVRAVYVAAGHGVFELRQVRTGRVRGGHIEVLSGLRPGERIAVDANAAAATVLGRAARQ